ncbi:hypothetical protein GPECTOR_3g38 [Gonium pectorale]|uniref:GDP-Man:Man(3)GlcNAc(2)-PP-Dol alpha-1,2-mannosyltransferase n=1 Tax=Gonium pectorale TaxID=33097 RepID=A0A150GZF2_GONPE|nr:hypothetical protein GPECTOR_3g38 [Gonium pectorale]|eukprot:KXZ55239.1 hypothetical protein GPECTOR_3g38 [Gonium pectorale]
MEAILFVVIAAAAAVALGTVLATGAFFILARGLPPVQKGVVAFFHPFADGGGGGERVLWCAVKAVQEASQTARVVPLRRTHLVLPERYRRLTLVRQALGSIGLGLEALRQLVPEVFIDTTGWAFPYPWARWTGARVVAYVHYPTISTDMLGRVWAGAATYNNDAEIAESPVKTSLKLLYYQAFAAWYAACGALPSVVAVNSSWTRDHIRRLWFLGRPPVLVYPPVDTADLLSLPLDRKLKRLYLVSVAQFRPEKNHRLQLQAFALAKRAAGPTLQGQAVREARLVMIGGCRNADDQARLAGLQRHAEELGVAEHVDWVVNAPYSELRSLLGGAVGGLHTMLDEHFGISVVEYMAAGLVPIAHNSAGPKQDIVLPLPGEDGSETQTGFLASSAEEYAEAITRVLTMDQRERLRMAAAAQQQARRFSHQRFHQDFTAAVAGVLPP